MKKSYEDCIGLIKTASKDLLTSKQAEELLEAIDTLAAKEDVNQLASLEAKITEKITASANDLRESGLLEKRNALINASVQNKIMGYVSNFESPGKGLEAYLAGGILNTPGVRNSIDARGKALQSKYLGQMINDLEKDDLLPHFTSGEMDLDIIKELWELPNGKIGITKNPEAQKIANIVNKFQNDLVNRQNLAGAYIKLMPGYIVKQTHNTVSLRKAGYNTWKETVAPLLDFDKTFKGADPEEFLKEAYAGLVNGTHLRNHTEASAGTDALMSGFKGPANLAKKVSQERVLHFSSGESWQKYNDAFGTRDLREAVTLGFEMGARNLALMEGLGTNPEAMIGKIQDEIRRANVGDAAKESSINTNFINNIMAELTGKTRIPGGNLSAARIGQGVRVLNNLSKLGGAVISSITDIPFQAALLRYQGRSLLDGYANSFKNLIRGRGDAETKEIARLIGVGLDGINGDISSRFSAEDSMPGTMAKLQQRFFKLNGMAWWNDSHKTGVGLIISNDLAHNSSKKLAELRPDLAKNFAQYNIDEKAWDLIRETKFISENGNQYITPDKIADIPLERVVKVLDLPEGTSPSAVTRAAEDYRNQLEITYQNFLVDSADIAIPQPGVYEKALFNQGTQTGTPVGEALRYISQFKSFPVTVIRKGMGRTLFGDGANDLSEALFKGKGDLVGLAHLMVATTITGYIAMTAKDTLKGRTARDPSDATTWKQAMLQGGGLGIYGDFMLGEFSRHGNSLWATALGPTASTVEEIFAIKTAIQQDKEVAPKMLKTAINNTPFANLFYTRAAMDYLFIYQLQETLNPGYLSRLEQSIISNNNQEYYMPPTDSIPYGGGDKLFEGVR